MEEERYVIQSITFQDQVSVSFNQLNQRRSLKEFRTECIKAHCVSLSNQLYCIVEGFVLMEEEVEVEVEAEVLGSGRPGGRAVRGGR